MCQAEEDNNDLLNRAGVTDATIPFDVGNRRSKSVPARTYFLRLYQRMWIGRNFLAVDYIETEEPVLSFVFMCKATHKHTHTHNRFYT